VRRKITSYIHININLLVTLLDQELKICLEINILMLKILTLLNQYHCSSVVYFILLLNKKMHTFHNKTFYSYILMTQIYNF